MFEILIVDDEKDIRTVIASILKDEGHETRLAGGAGECMHELEKKCPDILLLDIWLKDSNLDGIDILKYVKKNHPEIPVIIISGHGTIEIAVAAIKQGAYDFIEKPFNTAQLLVIVERACEAARLRQKDKNRQTLTPADFAITGQSAVASALKKEIDALANKNSRILIHGEKGVGKYRIARLIHALSERASMPFYRVECADPNLHTQLFEQKENPPSPGRVFEEINGGVLYFNEIADLSAELQEAVLRFLTSKSFASTNPEAPIETDIRIISSTRKNLEDEVKKGNFRHDLYNRLNIIELNVPSLKERGDDIEELAACFIDEISVNTHLHARPLSQEALTRLKSAEWPGNMHQLKNLLEQVLIFGPPDATQPIMIQELVKKHSPFDDSFQENGATENFLSMSELPLREARQAFEREYLAKQIRRFGGNVSRTSEFIGMERSALHRKLKLLKINTSEKKNDA